MDSFKVESTAATSLREYAEYWMVILIEKDIGFLLGEHHLTAHHEESSSIERITLLCS